LSAYGCVLTSPQGMLPLGLGSLNAALLDAIQAPDVETGAVLILANAPNNYGGIAGFNQYGMGTTNRTAVGTDPRLKFPQIMEHELGHAYANLHDEYVTFGGGFDSPSNPDHPEANVTNRVGSPPLKWNYWANRITYPGAFVGGAGFQGGVWHPDTNCMMNFLDNYHCAVCREEIVRRTYGVGGLSPMANIVPAAANITLSDLNFADLSYTDATPTGGRYEWWIDGVQVTNTGVPITTSLRVYGAVLGYGPHTVEARIFDRSLEFPTNPTSEFVRRDPNNFLRGTRIWSIDVQPPSESRRLSYQRGNADGFYSGLGKHIAVLGDIDLDGVRDFAYGTNVHVHLVSGATRLPIATMNANGTGPGTVPFVAGVGAINGDAYPDIAIGSPGGANRIDLYSGLDQSLIFGFAPLLSANTTFGGDICALGRIDNDTRDDFAVAFEGAAPAVKVYAGNNGSVIRTYTGAAGAAVSAGA
ncbi:MAG: M64 family metallopeptidase, partial [Deltaproteobacteria bacterium]|nr:M64 family metallopeptidase [Kofleriaceae bacterium]